MAQALVNGIHIDYEMYGSGMPLLVIPGLGFSRNSWRDQIPDLSRRYKVVVMSQRGHGDSDKPHTEENYSLPNFVEDARLLLDHLGIKHKVILIGHSLGAKVVQLFCLTHPERVQAAILVTPLTGARPKGPAEGEFGEEQIREVQQMGWSAYMDYLQPLLFTPGTDPQFVKEHVRDCYKIPEYAYIAIVSKAMAYELEDSIAKITVPVLIIAGAGDQRIPVEEQEKMNRLLPNSWLKVIQGAGHMPQLEKPIETTRSILRFLMCVETWSDETLV